MNKDIQEQTECILGFNKFFDSEEEQNNIIKKCSKSSTEARNRGNKLYVKRHEKNDHRKILSYYSLCVALAPKDSEELALAYSNRSALLMHLGKYKECLTDIERALKITASSEVKDKLISRKVKCVNDLVLSANCKKQKKLELPEITPSKEIPCASESVSIGYNEKYGRYIVATRDIKPGEIIIAEKGYVAFPKNEQLYLVCSHCLAFAWTGIPCDTCCFSIYCSEKCKKEAWDEYHDIECCILPYFYCKTFQNTDENHITISVKTIARLFIIAVKREGLKHVLDDAKIIDTRTDMHIKGFFSNGVFNSFKFRSCYNLLDYPENNDEYYESMIVNLLFRHTNILNCKINHSDSDMIDASTLITVKNLLVKLRNILDVNAFSYQGSICNCPNVDECTSNCDSNRGTIVAPCCSLINHSCNPNVSRMFLPGLKIILFTTAPVKKGEQLCDNYGPTISMEKTKRQEYLQRTFNFTCECEPCRENWPTNILNWKPDATIMSSLRSEFEKKFQGGIHALFYDSDKNCRFDEETLQDAVKRSLITYKNVDNYTAFLYTFPYRIYIDRAFYKLYGEECNMPNDC